MQSSRYSIENSASAPVVSRLANHPRLRNTVRKFAQRLNDQIGEIERAWQVRDYEALQALGHWLKGAGGTVGYDAFTEPAYELEQLAKARKEDQIGAAIERIRSLSQRLVVPEQQADGEELLHGA